MTCLEFETLWNQRLDAIRGPDSVSESSREAADSSPSSCEALEEHAANCASCRALANRYRVLQHSIEALTLSDSPRPPNDFAARFLAEHEELLSASRSRTLSVRWSLAAAAILLAALGLFARREQPPERILVDRPIDLPQDVIAGAEDPVISPRIRPLNETLAEATSVTLNLMWEASEPAARLGRDVLGSYRIPSAPTLTDDVPVPLDLAEIDAPALTLTNESEKDVLRSLGEQVGGGVRPLSRPALNAFAFLMPKIPEPEEFEGLGTPP